MYWSLCRLLLCPWTLIHLLPPGGRLLFSAWVRADPATVLPVTGHTDPGALLTCCTAGATPLSVCSASGSTTPLESWEHQAAPSLGTIFQGVWPVFFKWPGQVKDRNKQVSQIGEAEGGAKVRRQVDPGLTFGVEKAVLLVAWWSLKQHLWRS